MDFITRSFDALTTRELHDIFVLRAQVFVVEQMCAYQDPDRKDPGAHHVLGYENGRIVSYCRLIPPGLSYPEPAIGRVVVAPDQRKKGFGKHLMEYAIGQTRQLFPKNDIVISAQTYLERFYARLGFYAEGTSYLEDNIPHIKMRLLKGTS